MAQLVVCMVLFLLLCSGNPSVGLAVLDCWFEKAARVGNAGWRLFLETKKPAGCKDAADSPVQEPLWCRFRKCRMSVKRERRTTRREREVAEEERERERGK